MGSSRVYYVERQRLSSADLRAEQEYLAGLDERHYLNQHAPGVVRGLRVGTDERGRLVVEPGVAVDAYGRELLLAEPVTLPVTLQLPRPGVDVWLLFCLQPLRPRQPGRAPCSDENAPRWREDARVLVEEFEGDEPPSAPADGAVFLGRLYPPAPPAPPPAPDVAYTSVRGREVKDPGGRASVQVGPRTGRDQTAFAVSVADDAGNTTRRLALERRGGNVVEGTVELLDYRARATISLFENTLRLLVEAKRPGPSGQQIQVAAAEKTDGQSEVAELEFLNYSREPGLPQSEGMTVAKDSTKLEEELKAFNQTSRLVRLDIISRAEPLEDEMERPDAEGAEKARAGRELRARDDRNVSLSGAGGTLEFDLLPGPEEEGGDEFVPRGCYDDRVVAAAEPPEAEAAMGLSFRPVAEPLKGQPLPRVYVAKVQDGDRTVEQLRIDLGEKKDADETERFAIRKSIKSGTGLEDWLTVAGTCAVTIPAVEGGANLPISLQVFGTIEQSPIKPDHTDPDFTNRLVAAWLEGLRSTVDASTVVAITIPQSPAIIESGKPWSYTLRLANTGDAPVSAERVLETLYVGGGTIPSNLPAQANIPAKGFVDKTVGHEGEDFPEGEIKVEVTASGKINNFPWWRAGPEPPLPIKVVKPPTVDFSDVPESVPPNLAWSHVFEMVNVSESRLTLLSATLTELTSAGPTVRPLLVGTVRLDGGDAHEFTPATHPGGMQATFDYEFKVEYGWGDGVTRVFKETHRVTVGPQLTVAVNAPASGIVRGADWSFTLSLANVADAALRVTSLKFRVRPPNNSQFTTVSGVTPLDLGTGESRTTAAINGPRVNSADTQVTLEVQAVYEHGGRTWQPPLFTQLINVTDPPPPAPADDKP